MRTHLASLMSHARTERSSPPDARSERLVEAAAADVREVAREDAHRLEELDDQTRTVRSYRR